MEWQLQDYVKITLHGVPGSDYSLTWNCHLLMARWPFDLYFIVERLWHVSILIIIYHILFISELCSNRMKNRAILWVFSSIVWLTIFMSWYTHVKYSIDILYFLKTKVAKIEKYSRNFIWKQALIRYFGQSLKET